MATLVAGAAMGAAAFALDFFGYFRRAGEATGWRLDNMTVSFYLCAICMALMAAVSWLTPEPLKEEAIPLVWKDWREPLRGDPHGHFLANYRVLSAVLVATFVVLYIVFR